MESIRPFFVETIELLGFFTPQVMAHPEVFSFDPHFVGETNSNPKILNFDMRNPKTQIIIAGFQGLSHKQKCLDKKDANIVWNKHPP